MTAYRHMFSCTACGKHVFTISESATVAGIGRTHDEALENGSKAFKSDPDTLSCGGLGTMKYCSGSYVKKGGDAMSPEAYKACVPPHKGTEEIKPFVPSAPSAEWVDFARRVKDGWDALVASGYSNTLRGVNNYREYKASGKVSAVLQSCGGVVAIDGGNYTISNSLLAGVSLKRQMPGAVGAIQSYIYHL